MRSLLHLDELILLRIFASSDSCSEFVDLLWYAQNVKQWAEEDFGLMVTMVWGIWTNWNEVQHGKSKKLASVLAR